MSNFVYEENREVEHARDGLTITRTLRVEPVAFAPAVVNKLLGGVFLVGRRIVRQLPHRDPLYRYCFCSSVRESPFEVLNTPGSNSELAVLNRWNYSNSVRLVATYKTLDLNPPDQNNSNDDNSEKELASEDFDYGAKQLTLPNQYLYFNEGTDTVTLPVEGLQATKTIPTLDYRLVRHYCIRRPHDAIVKLTGRVNQSAFTLQGYTWAAETMRFDGLHAARKIANRGFPFWELAYRFAIQTIFDKCSAQPAYGFSVAGQTFVGWNRMFRPSKAEWWYPTFAADGARRIYQFDEDIQQSLRGKTVKGLALLFHPAAT